MGMSSAVKAAVGVGGCTGDTSRFRTPFLNAEPIDFAAYHGAGAGGGEPGQPCFGPQSSHDGLQPFCASQSGRQLYFEHHGSHASVARSKIARPSARMAACTACTEEERTALSSAAFWPLRKLPCQPSF